MRIDIISVVPDLLESPLSHSILKRARDKGLLEVNVINLREYAFWISTRRSMTISSAEVRD
jgi:tRNA (guanine37-N1)-methyltransferase